MPSFRNSLYAPPTASPPPRSGTAISLALFICSLLGSLADLSAQTLTSTKAVRQLTSEEASHSIPVNIQGIIIGFSEPRSASFVLIEDGESIYVKGPDSLINDLKRGDYVSLKGLTASGGFAPIIELDSLKTLGTRPLPAPQPLTLSQINQGGLDAHWVQTTGIVRSCNLFTWKRPPHRFLRPRQNRYDDPAFYCRWKRTHGRQNRGASQSR